jgi:hypothetical protein
VADPEKIDFMITKMVDAPGNICNKYFNIFVICGIKRDPKMYFTKFSFKNITKKIAN